MEPSADPIKTSTPTVTPASIPQIKEFFIPLGSGTNSTDDWDDVSGLKVSIDSATYTIYNSSDNSVARL